MSNFFVSPNMSLIVPVPTVDPGPDWAQNLNASLTILDAHNHSAGSGVQITPSGLNINADLTFGLNNAIGLRSVRFNPNTSPLSGVSDVGCIYESGVDLYYNDGAGNQIRITQSGSVAGASGTITGLPSGTASASYSSASGTFVWLQATATAANMDAATLIIRYPGSYPTPAGNAILIEAPSSLASQYAFTLPASTPATSPSYITSNTSGVLSYSTPNQVAAATSSPQFGGIPTAGAQSNSFILGRQTTSQDYMIRGAVTSTGTIQSGTGFSVSHPSTGFYTITFSIPFAESLFPVTVATLNNSAGYISTTGASNTLVDIVINTGTTGSPIATDANFTFMIVGIST